MIRRPRSVTALAVLVAGAVILISSTQTWFSVTLNDGSEHALAVPGADAVAVLAPLALAVLALGAAMSIAGRILATVLSAAATAAGVALIVLVAPLLGGATTSAVAPTVTEWTGLQGLAAVERLIADSTATVWPVVAFGCALIVVLAGVFGLATAHRWRATGRRYRTDRPSESPGGEPAETKDAIEAWDDLSHGDDPTR